MNHIKLQQDILKARYRESTGGRNLPYMYGLTDTGVGIVVDRSYLIMVPWAVWYLDLEKIFQDRKPVNIENMIKGHWDTIPAYDTGMIRVLTQDKRNVGVFKLDKPDSEEIWIAINNLKYFDKELTTYTGTAKNKPVYLYEYEALVGMILPVAHN